MKMLGSKSDGQQGKERQSKPQQEHQGGTGEGVPF
jgi:hypothetical protein